MKEGEGIGRSYLEVMLSTFQILTRDLNHLHVKGNQMEQKVQQLMGGGWLQGNGGLKTLLKWRGKFMKEGMMQRVYRDCREMVVEEPCWLVFSTTVQSFKSYSDYHLKGKQMEQKCVLAHGWFKTLLPGIFQLQSKVQNLLRIKSGANFMNFPTGTFSSSRPQLAISKAEVTLTCWQFLHIFIKWTSDATMQIICERAHAL